MPASHFLPSHIAEYAKGRTQREPDLLAALRRETHLKALYPRMLTSAIMGRFMAMISRMLRPGRVLEIGTYTGYSAICFAEGLQEDGHMICLEKNRELNFILNPYLERAGISRQVEVRFGDAMELIPQLQPSFDLIFLDADKGNYPNYYEMVLPLLRPGGLMLADNVLWSGKVTDQSEEDKETIGIRRFNEIVGQDERVTAVLLPVDDGLMMIEKKEG